MKTTARPTRYRIALPSDLTPQAAAAAVSGLLGDRPPTETDAIVLAVVAALESAARVRHGGGLATASPETRARVAATGGRVAAAKGTARRWTPAEAAEAGRKGGAAGKGGRKPRAATTATQAEA